MEALKKKILAEGEVYEGNILKVDCFLNHQIDFPFMKEVGREFHRLYKDAGVNKILTIEASGIAVGSVVALEFACPLVFAKKSKTKNIAGDVYKTQVASFTHGTTYDVMVSKRFLTPEDRVLIVDDFLAVGHRPGAPKRRHPGGLRHRDREGLPARRRSVACRGCSGGVPGHRGVHGPHHRADLFSGLKRLFERAL